MAYRISRIYDHAVDADILPMLCKLKFFITSKILQRDLQFNGHEEGFAPKLDGTEDA